MRDEFIQYWYAAVVTILFYASIIYYSNTFYRFNNIILFSLIVGGSLLIIKLYNNPLSIILKGVKYEELVSNELRNKLQEIVKTKNSFLTDSVRFLVFDDKNINMFCIKTPECTNFFLTSKAVEVLTLFDFDTIFTYFDIVNNNKRMMFDTIYLTIGRPFEYLSFGANITESILSLVTKKNERLIIDHEVVAKTNNLLIYKRLLEKVKASNCVSTIPASFGIVGFDKVYKDIISKHYSTIDDMQTRINSLSNY
ncbi:MAG: hypothetical protein U0525_04990 [Patescibacteria group bacterium]